MTGQTQSQPTPIGVWAALLANLLVIGLLVYMGLLESDDPDRYRMSLQEDEYLEWATFWGFFGAAVLALLAALRQRRERGGVPWFFAGLSLFCFVVAMEEISWLQRLIDYRPPAYFLEKNFQQEPNLHNVISTDVRKLALRSVIGGFGIVLPILMVVPGVGRLLRRIGVSGPSLALIPAFGAALWLYVDYPWDYTGEIVELMVSFGFLFALLAMRPRAQPASQTRRVTEVAVAWTLVMALGWATAAAARFQTSARLENVDAARAELETLKNDFLRMSDPERERFITRCGIHKRVYSYVEKYDRDALTRGQFAALQQQGLPEERAKYFIDPWNAPYWIRDRCDRDRTRRSIFVYSFGPNRRRDSSTWEVQGDDVGAYIYVQEE